MSGEHLAGHRMSTTKRPKSRLFPAPPQGARASLEDLYRHAAIIRIERGVMYYKKLIFVQTPFMLAPIDFDPAPPAAEGPGS